MGKYYILRDQNRSKALGLVPTNNQRIDLNGFLRGELMIKEVFSFKRNIGSILYDFSLGGAVQLRLFNNRFFTAL